MPANQTKRKAGQFHLGIFAQFLIGGNTGEVAGSASVWRAFNWTCLRCSLEEFHNGYRCGVKAVGTNIRGGRALARRKVSNAEIWDGIVQESGIDFIPLAQIRQVLNDIYRLQDIFSDKLNPKCLYPIRQSDDSLAYPVDCGKPAERRSHSIQRAKSLEEIACRDGAVRGGGLYVYQLFPDISHTLEQTAGPSPSSGRRALAQRWPWDIQEIPPHSLTIEEASTGHFACDDDDQRDDALGRADNIRVPDLGARTCLHDHNPPAGFESFMEILFYLAYRTLIFRISQLRGVEKAGSQLLMERSAQGNRYGVRMVLEVLEDLMGKLDALYRFKQGFDRRILGDSEAIHLVHHVVSFQPIIRYACSEYTAVKVGYGKRAQTIWMSVNVLPLNGVTWLIVAYPCQRNSVEIDIRQRISQMVVTNRRGRRREDLKMMRECTNLYASPDDFRLMSDVDKLEISRSMATATFGDMLSQGLKILRESEGGQKVIRRVEARAGR